MTAFAQRMSVEQVELGSDFAPCFDADAVYAGLLGPIRL
jgi:hypothetical protein